MLMMSEALIQKLFVEIKELFYLRVIQIIKRWSENPRQLFVTVLDKKNDPQ